LGDFEGGSNQKNRGGMKRENATEKDERKIFHHKPDPKKSRGELAGLGVLWSHQAALVVKKEESGKLGVLDGDKVKKTLREERWWAYRKDIEERSERKGGENQKKGGPYLSGGDLERVWLNTSSHGGSRERGKAGSKKKGKVKRKKPRRLNGDSRGTSEQASSAGRFKERDMVRCRKRD